MPIERHKLPVDGLWHKCPKCESDGGWHVFFKKSAEPKSLHMILQCPNCKSQVDLGLQVHIVQ